MKPLSPYNQTPPPNRYKDRQIHTEIGKQRTFHEPIDPPLFPAAPQLPDEECQLIAANFKQLDIKSHIKQFVQQELLGILHHPQEHEQQACIEDPSMTIKQIVQPILQTDLPEEDYKDYILGEMITLQNML